MTHEAQRIAIAEACGWTDIFHNSFPRGWLGHRPNEDRDNYLIPDYPNDLNAMHEAENTLNVREKQNYISTLRNICVVAGCWPETATADQRAEAFPRTVGKWEEGK